MLIIVTPHLPQVGHGWGLLRICKLFDIFPTPGDNFMLHIPYIIPYILYRDSKNNEIFWTNPRPLLDWGRWGLTVIGALWQRLLSSTHPLKLLSFNCKTLSTTHSMATVRIYLIYSHYINQYWIVNAVGSVYSKVSGTTYI